MEYFDHNLSEDYFDYNFTDDYHKDYYNYSYTVDVAVLDILAAYELQFVLYCIVIPLISCIGIVGNILILITLCRKVVQPTVTIVMVSLVLTDISIIILSLITMTFLSFSMKYYHMSYFMDVIYPNIFAGCNFLIMAFQQSNVWITVIIAIERYIAMCLPFFASKIRTKKNIKIAVIVIFGISLIYNSPRLFATYSKSNYVQESNKTYYTIEITQFGQSHFYSVVFGIWMYAIVIYIIPILILIFISIPTIRQLLSMRRRSRTLSAQQSGEINLTVCIILVVMIFVICQTPGIFAQIREVFSSAFTVKLLSISNTLFVLNSSINFFIYTAAGSRFRHILKTVFVPAFKRRQRSINLYAFRMINPDGSTSTTR